MFVCALFLYPATPGWGVWCVCVYSGSGFGCAPPLLAGMLACVCVRLPALLVPRHSWLGCVVWVSVWAGLSAAPRQSWLGCWHVCVFVCPLCLHPATRGWSVWCGCVFGLGFRLPPATPGWGVGVCVCSCAHSACTPPLLAGVCGVCVCASVRVSAAPRHSWLGCWGVCVCSCARSACSLSLLAGVLGVGVCAWARVLAAPRHSWLGCWGVCVLVCPLLLYPATSGSGVRRGVCAWARGSAAPRHSWLGCSGVCVFVCPLSLHPATPGWGVWCVCVCLGSGFGCALPLLAGVLGSVCVCVRAPPVPRHSWLGCVVCVCLLGLGFWLRPATPRWAVGMCVRLCARSACSPPLLAGVCAVGACAWARVLFAPRHTWLGCWGVGAFVGPLCFYPATPGLGVWCGCVCLGSGLGCAPPLLAPVFGCVCVCVRAPPVPHHSWLGFVVWVCVLGLGFRLLPATLCSGVGVSVCFCARSACTPRLLAGSCGVGVCAWARVSAAPRHTWLGCSSVCVFVCALRLYPATPGWGVLCGCLCLVLVSAAPRHSWLGCWGVCVFVCALCLYPATPGWA